jgi:hypothetical protein
MTAQNPAARPRIKILLYTRRFSWAQARVELPAYSSSFSLSREIFDFRRGEKSGWRTELRIARRRRYWSGVNVNLIYHGEFCHRLLGSR